MRPWLILLVLSACGDDSGGTPPTFDARPTPDARGPDAAPPDAEPAPDAERAADAARPDAPQAADASLPDASAPDAASPDAFTADAAPPDSRPPPAPRTIPGGGVGDGPLAGTLHVTVLDATTDATISAATVRVSPAPGSATPTSADTNAFGIATFTSGTLSGPQVVTVTKTGYLAETWVGVDGANATIHIRQNPEPVTTATVNGSLLWTGAPTVAGHSYLAIIEYTLAGPFDDYVAGGQVGCQLDFGAAPTPCIYSLATRTGSVMVYARIFDCNGFDAGGVCQTPTFVGMALPAPGNRRFTLANGDTVNNVTLNLVTHVSRSVNLEFQQAPSVSLTNATALTYVDAGTEGWIDLTFFSRNDPTPGSATPRSVAVSLPTFTLPGETTTATYNFLDYAFAPATPILSLNVRGGVAITTGATIALGAYLGLPSNPTVSGSQYTYSKPAAAQFTAAQIVNPAGSAVYWGVTVLDGTTTFFLPAVTPDPIPAGPTELRVQAYSYPAPAFFDHRSFSFSDFSGDLRLSQNRVAFTH